MIASPTSDMERESHQTRLEEPIQFLLEEVQDQERESHQTRLEEPIQFLLEEEVQDSRPISLFREMSYV